MTERESRQQLLQEANDAYREGNPIMGDAEYDALEAELDLENVNPVIGEKHSPELTIKHPFIMGSLSKIQVHFDKHTSSVDWESIYQSIRSYVGDKKCIITPKYDGCSFEVYHKANGEISVSTRGDGWYGRDIKKHIMNAVPASLAYMDGEWVMRGEVLVDKQVFERYHKDKFVNTRSFVAGVTGQKDPDENLTNDLEIVIYDFRRRDDLPFNDGWYDDDWRNLRKESVEHFPTYFMEDVVIDSADKVKFIYEAFADYRMTARYSLDGFVIKPIKRSPDFDSARPKDCVAIKFLPMTADTYVTKITWELGKSRRYTPIIWYNPVYIDGKKCVKCSGHNYHWTLNNGAGVGAKIRISMAGDIIPYCLEVLQPVHGYRAEDMPSDSYIDGVHLMKEADKITIQKSKFRYSALTLDIPGLGEAQIDKVIKEIEYENKPDHFFGIGVNNNNENGFNFPTSIFDVTPSRLQQYIAGKMGEKIAKSYQQIINEISLETIIETLNIPFCGKKVSKAVANYLVSGVEEFESMAKAGYEWAMDETSVQYGELMSILYTLGKDIEYFRTVDTVKETDNTSKTFIMMTGEPVDYHSKADFLKSHPEYQETSSWKQVQIVFTNSMMSQTTKMKQALKRGIRIELY